MDKLGSAVTGSAPVQRSCCGAQRRRGPAMSCASPPCYEHPPEERRQREAWWWLNLDLGTDIPFPEPEEPLPLLTHGDVSQAVRAACASYWAPEYQTEHAATHRWAELEVRPAGPVHHVARAVIREGDAATRWPLRVHQDQVAEWRPRSRSTTVKRELDALQLPCPQYLAILKGANPPGIGHVRRKEAEAAEPGRRTPVRTRSQTERSRREASASKTAKEKHRNSV